MDFRPPVPVLVTIVVALTPLLAAGTRGDEDETVEDAMKSKLNVSALLPRCHPMVMNCTIESKNASRNIRRGKFFLMPLIKRPVIPRFEAMMICFNAL